MGVSGSGKTTIGKELASKMGWTFIDADDHHPPANIKKMGSGKPLTDDDRRPWLMRLNLLLKESITGNNIVLACSALKRIYREWLTKDIRDRTGIIFLNGSPGLITQRMQERKDHFMPASLLRSQFETLEPPQQALVLDISADKDELIRQIIDYFQLK